MPYCRVRMNLTNQDRELLLPSNCNGVKMGTVFMLGTENEYRRSQGIPA